MLCRYGSEFKNALTQLQIHIRALFPLCNLVSALTVTKMFKILFSVEDYSKENYSMYFKVHHFLCFCVWVIHGQTEVLKSEKKVFIYIYIYYIYKLWSLLVRCGQMKLSSATLLAW